MPGTTELGRGERETRGEHRGRGERLTSVSRFVFSVPAISLFCALLALPAQARAQDADSAGGYTIGVRLGGVYSTRLIADDIGFSILPDTADVLDGRFVRDTVAVAPGIAPDVTLVGGMPFGESTLQLAIGYSFGSVHIRQADLERDAGSLAVGHAVLGVERPVRGFHARAGIGALWMHGGDVPAVSEMRAINPLFEAAVVRRWPWRGLAVDAGLTGHVVHLASDAVDRRGGQAGFVYRLGLALGITRGFGR